MNARKNAFIYGLIVAALGIVIGIILTVFGDDIFNIACVILGIFIIINALPTFIASLANISDKSALAAFILSTVSILMGIVLIVRPNGIFMIIVGVYLLVFPICRLIAASDKKAQLASDLGTIILGLALILVGPGKIITYAGITLIVLSAVYAVYITWQYIR